MVSRTVLLVLVLPIVITSIRLLYFVQLHFLHLGTLQRYVSKANATDTKNGGSWALVTGASDGIGFGFVEELASQGFNIILHGRNKAKLEGLVQKVQSKHPSLKFRILVVNASERDGWSKTFEDFVSELNDANINLKLLVNNVGGTGGSFFAFEKMVERDTESVQRAIDVNASFPAAITHALLPTLVRNEPGLIINIGSVAASFPPPYLALYAGSKAFNLAWNESLASEMEVEKHNIEVIGVTVGRVINSSNPGAKGTLFMPSPRTFAKATLSKVGCGRSTFIPYWPHELQISALNIMPKWLVKKILITETTKEMQNERRSR